MRLISRVLFILTFCFKFQIYPIFWKVSLIFQEILLSKKFFNILNIANFFQFILEWEWISKNACYSVNISIQEAATRTLSQYDIIVFKNSGHTPSAYIIK